jgi:hypothetical protein
LSGHRQDQIACACPDLSGSRIVSGACIPLNGVDWSLGKRETGLSWSHHFPENLRHPLGAPGIFRRKAGHRLSIEHICDEFSTTWLISGGKVIYYPDHSFDLEPGIKFHQGMPVGKQMQVLRTD